MLKVTIPCAFRVIQLNNSNDIGEFGSLAKLYPFIFNFFKICILLFISFVRANLWLESLATPLVQSVCSIAKVRAEIDRLTRGTRFNYVNVLKDGTREGLTVSRDFDKILLSSANFCKKNTKKFKMHMIPMHCFSSFILISISISEQWT